MRMDGRKVEKSFCIWSKDVFNLPVKIEHFRDFVGDCLDVIFKIELGIKINTKIANSRNS
jgi:hypothetical protein